jgi:transposase-like protein
MVTELGYSVPDVARQLGCSTAAIHRRHSEMVPLDPEVSQRMLLGEDEHKRLRKENSRLKMEVDIPERIKAGLEAPCQASSDQRERQSSGSICKRQ